MSDAMLYTPSGCVLYLDLRKPVGDKLHDYSGHGNHGTVHGAKLNMELPTRGLEFDGVDDYVEVPNSDVLNPDFITLEVLMMLKENANGAVATKQYTQYDFIVYDVDDDGFVEPRFDGRTAAGEGLTLAVGSYHLSTYRWYHFAVTYDGSKVEIYADGVCIGSKEQAGVLASTSNPLRVGLRPDDSLPFHGIIALVRIYNRALSSDEVKKCFEDIQRRILRRIVAARDVSVR